MRERSSPVPYIPERELSIFLWNLIIIGARVRAACAGGVMIVRLMRKQLWERGGEGRGIRVTSLKHMNSFASDQLIVTGQHRRPKPRWLT